MNHPRYWLVIPAAGIGQRMQADRPKQYLSLANRFLLDVTVQRLLAAYAFDGCFIALSGSDPWWDMTESARDPRIQTCEGGRERADSVMAALRALRDHARPEDWVLVHDVARPCLSREDLHRLIDQLSDSQEGGLLAAAMSDTVKQIRPGSERIAETVDRSLLWRAQTPQQFRYGELSRALEKCLESGVPVTDESSAMEHMGVSPRIVAGRADNLKVTVPEDLALASWILERLDERERLEDECG